MKHLRVYVTSAVGAALLVAVVGCQGTAAVQADKTTVQGVYDNAEKNASLEFMPEGKAHLSLTGVGAGCTYKQSGRKVTLTCEGEDLEFTVGDDGALSGPTSSYFARLQKRAK